jgi:isocitrate lyase
MSDATWPVAGKLMDSGASVLKLAGCIHRPSRAIRSSDPVLVSTGEAIRRLDRAGEILLHSHRRITTVACTSARIAVAIESQTDPMDARFLTCTITSGKHHAYCGGLDAAIARALIYAGHVDVVCFRAARFHLHEARRFAAEIRAAHPITRLALCLSAAPGQLQCSETEHLEIGEALCSLGYDGYFYSQFGSLVMPRPLPDEAWVMFDDVAPERTSADWTHKPQYLLEDR